MLPAEFLSSPTEHGVVVSDQTSCRTLSGESRSKRNGERHRSSRARHSFRFEFAVEQESALLHADEAEGFYRFCHLGIKPGAVVGDLENDAIILAPEAGFDARGVGVTGTLVSDS